QRNWEWYYLKQRSRGQGPAGFIGNGTRAATSVAFSPDGRRLAVSWGREARDLNNRNKEVQGEVRVWDVVNGNETLTLADYAGPVHQIAYSPDGLQLATLGGDAWDRTAELRVVDLARGGVKFKVPFPNARATSLAFSPDGARIAVGGGDGMPR